jgi:Protein of unknown function (DUF5661)
MLRAVIERDKKGFFIGLGQFSKILYNAPTLLIRCDSSPVFLKPKKISFAGLIKFGKIVWRKSCVDSEWAHREGKMKTNIFLQIAAIVLAGFAFMLVVKSDHTWAQTQLRQSVEQKFEEYRKAIKDTHQVDIKNFKDKIPGGIADGKAITNYDLKELLEGIKWEREHSRDNLIALEIAMDHLERIPDYYTHLVIMERGCLEDKFRKM